MPHKRIDNSLVAIRRNKVTLTLNKPAYIGMCILDLSKALIYEKKSKIHRATTQYYYSQIG